MALKKKVANALSFATDPICFHSLLEFVCDFELCDCWWNYSAPISQSLPLARASLDQLDQVRSVLEGREWPYDLISDLLKFILHEKNMKLIISNASA